MRNKSLNIYQSLRFRLTSRLFALIIVLLSMLGGYQYYQIGEQAEEYATNDKLVASNYFSTVLVQAIWEFDEILVNELIAARTNIDSLVAVSMPNVFPNKKISFIRDEGGVFVRNDLNKVIGEDLTQKKVNVFYQENIIGELVLYFNDSFYYQKKQDAIVALLLKMFILALVLLALFYYFINAYVVKPISNLYHAVEELYDDKTIMIELEKNLPNNEIKLLAKKYTEVYFELKEHKKQLEDIVEIRTLGIKNVNQKLESEIKSRTVSEKIMELAKLEAQKSDEEKTKLLSHITHELRTPLNGILGYAEMLLERDLPSDALKDVSHINRCGNSLLELINNILDSNKIEYDLIEFLPVATSIAELLEEIKTIVFPRSLKKGLDFEISIAKNLPKVVLADLVKLRQVLLNLIANAIKFTNQGYVKLIVTLNEDNHHQFSIEDSGQGIPKQDQEKIFEAYQQSSSTKTKEASTGLGLSISKSFVECMGGVLSVESSVSSGSRFFFSLHLMEHSLGRVKKKVTGLHGGERKSILIVDDSTDNLYILTRVLQRACFNIEQALSANLAYKSIETKEPDLIFMDVQMPEVDGIEAARVIKEKYPHIIIIAFTANIYDSENKKLKELCFDDYLYKPIDRQLVYKMLSTQLDLSLEYG